MLVRVSKAWEIEEGQATSESVYLDRRSILKTMGVGLAAWMSPSSLEGGARGPEEVVRRQESEDGLYPAPRNADYSLDRSVTDQMVAGRQNIFDEFSLERDKIWSIAREFRTYPWRVHIGGAVEKAVTVDIADLVRRFGLEERLYRHRCVEPWSMAVPWTGFPLRKLVDFAKPLAAARYLRMVSFSSPEQAPGWYASRRVFPYYEALSLQEARHDLSLLVTGIYGKPLPPQHGAPLRLAIPWKYGYKSLKSIVSFQFTRERPGTFWNELAPHLYGFEANVDPTSTNPWPQAEETLLGTDEKRKTLPFNGYADQVGELYG